jgi:hypothetical protein
MEGSRGRLDSFDVVTLHGYKVFSKVADKELYKLKPNVEFCK